MDRKAVVTASGTDPKAAATASGTDPKAATTGSNTALWIGLVCGAVFFVLSIVDLAAQVRYSWSGVPATGRVVEFHQPSARSMTVYGVVSVALPGAAPFRWEVEDTFGQQSWSVGGDVPLLCARLHADHVSCTLRSLVDRFGPALFFGLIGGSVALLSLLALLRARRTRAA
jgi:hypothetical protein